MRSIRRLFHMAVRQSQAPLTGRGQNASGPDSIGILPLHPLQSSVRTPTAGGVRGNQLNGQVSRERMGGRKRLSGGAFGEPATTAVNTGGRSGVPMAETM